ncbi:YkyB family protein [Priestia abyssalis]|uniref:YkyB family protein n=1 Tax=Priestia abyssalis TaxID=1221450 RepID=UPI000995796D|nr:YkyB family protein [Priestia abyssalis]
MSDLNGHEPLEESVNELAQAIFTVNRHAKAAPDPKKLYTLKKLALEKLLTEGKAKKEGLHFSPNPGKSQQKSDVLVSVGDYYFHMPPKKEDFQQLPHLGHLNHQYRNPKTSMSLSYAKRILSKYAGYWVKPPQHPLYLHRKKQAPVFKPLGKSYF